MNNSNSSANIRESAVPPLLQFTIAFLGNTVAVVVLVLSSKKHKWKPFYKLVGGLIITDGGGILLTYPPVITRYASNFNYDFPYFLCSYISFVWAFTLLSSAMIVCVMSFDRCFAILYPFTYRKCQKKRRINLLLGIIWVFSAIISSLHLIGLGSTFNFYPGSWCFLNFVRISTLERIDSYIYSILGLSILLTTVVLNVIVIVSVIRNIKLSHRDLTMRRTRNSIYSAQRRTKNGICNVVVLVFIVIVFSVCWAPLMCTILAHAASWTTGNGPRELLVLRLAITNSIADPWVYILLRKESIQVIRRWRFLPCENNRRTFE